MVHFVGAGPGAPDLITLRGAALLEAADVVIYAGSLVNPALLARCKNGCAVYNSAAMTLPEVLDVMERHAHQCVVRLHTGDPALYGAIREQLDALSAKGIEYDVTPGVSSLFGAAAALGAEFTLPGVSQSLIVTRLAGRTAVPEGEKLRELARHGASMAIFLSAGLLGGVQSELLAGGLPADTPAAIVYKATWPEEKTIRCTVGTLADAGAAENIRKTALVFVGAFLDSPYDKSRLYDPAFTTAYRRGSEGGEIAYLSFTERGRALAEKLRAALGGEAACTRDGVRLKDWTASHFPTARALVYVGAAGIAVRAVAPHLASKTSDPAVIAVDESGQFAIPLASGHLGGANALAREIARVTGGAAAVTTATDVSGVFAVDEWARTQGCAVANAARIKEVSGKLLAGELITVRSAYPIDGEAPAGVALADTDAPDVWVDIRPYDGLTVVPRTLTLGVGCRRGIARETLEARFTAFCARCGVLPEAVVAAATIDLKADEAGLLAFCANHGWKLQTYTAAELSAVRGTFTASDFVAETTGVDNVCERAAALSSGGALLARKFAGDGVTFALAEQPIRLNWGEDNG